MLDSDIIKMKKLIFCILFNLVLFSNALYSQIYKLEYGQSLYSAQILDKDNYAFVIKLYEKTYQDGSYYYVLYHNDKKISMYKDIEYYLLNSNNTVTTLGKENNVDNDKWSIKNSSNANALLYDKIEYINYSSSSNRALAFMRRDDVGYVVDINGSMITEIATFSSFWASSISDDGSKYAFAIEREGTNYIVNNGVETLLESGNISEIVLSKNGDRVIYKKNIDNKYYLVEGSSTLGPYKELNNITISDNNKYLAYSFKKMPVIEIIEEQIFVEREITNIVIITNYNTNMISNTNQNITNVSTNSNIINENITIITNIIGHDTNYINYMPKEEEQSNNENINQPYYTLSYISNANVQEYAIVESSNMSGSNSNIIVNDTYNFALYDNGTNATILTNIDVSISNMMETITKEIIIEDFSENIVFNNNIIATYDEVKKIDFSPDSKSLFYIFEKDNLYYMVIGGDESQGYSNILAYKFSNDDEVFTYNADEEIVVNSVIRDDDIKVKNIYYLNDNSILYEKKMKDSYLVKSDNYESAIYNNILSIILDENNNTYLFYALRGDKYYYVDSKRIEYGPYHYISPMKMFGDNLFYSIISDGKNISLIRY